MAEQRTAANCFQGQRNGGRATMGREYGPAQVVLACSNIRLPIVLAEFCGRQWMVSGKTMS
jgi:hypothetical protein